MCGYARFPDNVLVHNTVAAGFGEGYRKKCSIPQGGLLAMMVIAICTRSWIMQMRETEVQSMILADDLLVPPMVPDMPIWRSMPST